MTSPQHPGPTAPSHGQPPPGSRPRGRWRTVTGWVLVALGALATAGGLAGQTTTDGRSPLLGGILFVLTGAALVWWGYRARARGLTRPTVGHALGTALGTGAAALGQARQAGAARRQAAQEQKQVRREAEAQARAAAEQAERDHHEHQEEQERPRAPEQAPLPTTVPAPPPQDPATPAPAPAVLEASPAVSGPQAPTTPTTPPKPPRKLMIFGSRRARLEQDNIALQQELTALRQVLEQAGGGDVLRIRQAVAQEQARYDGVRAEQEQRRLDGERRLQDLDAALSQRDARLRAADQEIRSREQRLADLDVHLADAQVLADAGLSSYPHPAEPSVRLRERLDDTRARIKKMVRDKTAVHASTTFTFNNSAAKGRKFVSDMSKMMLRAYNAEAENCVLTVRAGNGEAARKRLERARDQAEKLGTLIDLRISYQYHSLRLEELRLALDYQNAKKAEKEAEREERARLREERRAQQELQAERDRLEKERQHYLNVLAQLEEQGRADEAAEMRTRMEEVDTQIEAVDSRNANIRAGYVYVISNLGSFGERMVKIGMTRRLDPMDRVRELGDASVPFNFDVHALFFSEDAVGLETSLHHHFADRRVNRVNARREFFYATPAEVRDALTEIASGSLLEFTEEPAAEQYRQSLQEAREEQAAADGE